MIVIAFVLLLAIGVPIAYVLGLTGIFHIFSTGNFIFLENIAQRMFTGVDNFSLLCVPLFILAGELMNSGGLTTRLANFARVLVGHFRGGLAYVEVLLCMFMGAIVGSATAETAISCKILVPEMSKDGYDKDFSAALAAASSIIGPIIPPSMIFVVYGVIAGVSIGGLFLAGILPGVLLGITLMVIAGIFSSIKKYPKRKKATLKELFKTTVEALPALLLPILILGGMLSGIFSPTETAGAAVFLAIIIGAFVYRNLEWRKIPQMVVDTVITTASVLIIVATANVFGWTLAVEQVPQSFASLLLSISDNPIIIMLIINVFLLLIGCVMEAFAAIVILVPVFVPVITQLGIDPLHFGLLMCFNLNIGMITPPVGLCLFVASNMTNITLEKISKAIVPYILAAIFVLMLVTYIPQISLWLPSLFIK